MSRKRGKRSKRSGKQTSKKVIVYQNRPGRSTGRSRRRGAGIVQFRSGSRGSHTPSFELACSLANPWECSSCIPDGASGVGCFSVKQVATLATGTGGTCTGFYLDPSPVTFSYTDTGSTASTPTISGNWSSAVEKATINGLYQAFRPVSAGIRATFIGNTQTDQGIILIGQLPAQFQLNNLTGTTLTTAQSQFQNYKLFPLRSGGQVTWRPETMNDQDTWFTTGGNAIGVGIGAIPIPLICVIAFATASVQPTLLIDAVVNFEGQYTSQTFMPGGLAEEPKLAEPGWFEKAKNMVRSVEAIIPFAANAVGTYLNKPMLGNMIGALASSMSSGLPVNNASYRGRITEM